MIMDPEYEFKLNSYESFMRHHLQYYGYFTGRNNRYLETSHWTNTPDVKTYKLTNNLRNRGLYASSSEGSDSSSDSDNEASRLNSYPALQEELLRTTQIIYSYAANGRMVPRLREPRQLYALATEVGPQQAPRWPSDIEVTETRIRHLHTSPTNREPLYKSHGTENMPSVRGEDMGTVVFNYDPSAGCFARSRVGGTRMPVGFLGIDNDPCGIPSLSFESRFECGNLAKAVQVRDNDYELWLRYDLYTNKHTQWFYFRVTKARPGIKYRFTIVNFMKPDSLYNNGMRPLMYSETDAQNQGIGWLRTGSNIKYYRNNKFYETGKGDKSFYSLTWTTTFAHEDDVVYFAHCYPYTYSDLQEYLTDLASNSRLSQICKQRILCRTLAGNFVYVLTITSPCSNPEEARHKKAVILTSRVHPGESNASWMMKGFLDFLLGTSADAQLLRDMFIFKIIPMLNPDGVIVGNYRCSLSGRDLNRNYKTKLKDAFPSVWYTRNMISRLLEEREVILYCDLHGHSRKQNVFIYGCENRHSSLKRLRERIFPVMLSKNAPDQFNYDSCKFKVQKSKEGTGRVVMWNMGIMNSFTMEATFCGSSLGKRKGTHFNISDYEQMGFHFLDTLLDYCDPDGAKCNNIMISLEEKIKLDILAKMDAMGMSTSDVDLSNTQLSSVLDESSDGGSDSSISDGLPVHLKFSPCLEKKKKLRSRKERDKNRTKPTNDETVFTPPKSEVHQAGKVATENTKSTHNIPCVFDENAKKPFESGYLEELTNTYVDNGINIAKEGPHFRYANTRKVNVVQDYSAETFNDGIMSTYDNSVNNMAFPDRGIVYADVNIKPPPARSVFSRHGDPLPDNPNLYSTTPNKIKETRALGDVINRASVMDDIPMRKLADELVKKTERQMLDMAAVKAGDSRPNISSKSTRPKSQCDPDDRTDLLPINKVSPFSPYDMETKIKRETSMISQKQNQKLWSNVPPTTVHTDNTPQQPPYTALRRGKMKKSMSVDDTSLNNTHNTEDTHLNVNKPRKSLSATKRQHFASKNNQHRSQSIDHTSLPQAAQPRDRVPTHNGLVMEDMVLHDRVTDVSVSLEKQQIVEEKSYLDLKPLQDMRTHSPKGKRYSPNQRRFSPVYKNDDARRFSVSSGDVHDLQLNSHREILTENFWDNADDSIDEMEESDACVERMSGGTPSRPQSYIKVKDDDDEYTVSKPENSIDAFLSENELQQPATSAKEKTKQNNITLEMEFAGHHDLIASKSSAHMIGQCKSHEQPAALLSKKDVVQKSNIEPITNPKPLTKKSKLNSIESTIKTEDTKLTSSSMTRDIKNSETPRKNSSAEISRKDISAEKSRRTIALENLETSRRGSAIEKPRIDNGIETPRKDNAIDKSRKDNSGKKEKVSSAVSNSHAEKNMISKSASGVTMQATTPTKVSLLICRDHGNGDRSNRRGKSSKTKQKTSAKSGKHKL